MDLNLVKVLVDIVDAGNLSEAGRRRGATRSQVSKELARLERGMGATLLRRTTRRLELTEQGSTLYEHAVRMLAEMDSARALIDRVGQSVHGHVRLSIPIGLGQFYLGAKLIEFQRRYPDIALRVLFSNRVADLISSEVDVAVRITSEPPLDQVARWICTVPWGLYASPAYCAEHGPFTQPEHLEDAKILTTPAPNRYTALTLRRHELVRSVRMRAHLQSENIPYLRTAVLGGVGVGVLPRYAMTSDVRCARAVMILPDCKLVGLDEDLYVLTLKDRHTPYAVKVLLDFLRQVLKPTALLGDVELDPGAGVTGERYP